MASAAVDCRPLRDTNTGTAALATLRITDTVSSPTAAGQRTPGSAKKVTVPFHGHLFGAEAIGRKFSVVPANNSAKAWEKATVLEFDADSGQHKVKYSGTKQEEWLFLAELRFKWTQVLPLSAPANPTYKPEYSRETAVGKKLKVYWPAMQKWYHGTVKSYDPKTEKHAIWYKDGDTQSLVLRHEPVIWCDDELAANGMEQPAAVTPRQSTSALSPRAVTSPRAASGAVGAFTRAQSATAGTAAGSQSAPRPPATAAASAGAGRPAAGLLRRSPSTAAPAPKAPTRTGRPVGRPPGSTKARALGAYAASGKPTGPATTASARNALAAAFAATVFGRSARFAAAAAGKSALGRLGYRPGSSQAGGIANGSMHGSRMHAAGSTAGSFLGSKQQQLQRNGTLGKHERDSSGTAAEHASKRFKRGAHVRAVSAGAPGRPSAIPDKHLAVGCRVAVYWRLDKVYYRGKITSYSPQSGRYTIKYDDGQSEQVMLERERFVWHSPRGTSAGYRSALHSLMQQLNADGLQPEPQIGVDGLVIPEVPGPEGAPHPPISGPGAVGWRIQLYWGADQVWHEAEVLSFDEARRKHHVLYLDGEEEWLDLSKENVVWIKATRHGAISAGVVTGDDVPKGRDAVGWHIAVYWKDDKTFYGGEIIDFENSTGRHKVLYNDGEEEWLHLRNERVIWRLAPADESTEEDDDDDELDELLGSDDDVLMIDGELVTAGRGQGRGSFKSRRKTRRLNDTDGAGLRSRGLDSDSASASSGHGGAAAGIIDVGMSDGTAVHQQQHQYGATASYSHNGLQQPVAASYGDLSNPQFKRGLAGGLAMKAGRGAGAMGFNAGYCGKASSGGILRQSSVGGRGLGSAAGGYPNLPPLQLRRTSGSGEALGSPVGRNPLTADEIQLLVKIVPGGKAADAAGQGSVHPAADSLPVHHVLQALPTRIQRAAGRLQRKMARLHMIFDKLATTAGVMGWRLDPQQLPSTSQLFSSAAYGPTSPRARAGRKAGHKGPTSPRGSNLPTSPRLVHKGGQSDGVAGSQAPADAALGSAVSPSSPCAAGSAALVSPSTGRTVPVYKTCAVKSKPGVASTAATGILQPQVKPASEVLVLRSEAVTAGEQDTPAALLQQQSYATPGTAAMPATVAVSAPVSLSGPIAIAVPAAMLASPAVVQMQQRLPDHATLAAVAAATGGASHAVQSLSGVAVKQLQAAAGVPAGLTVLPVKANGVSGTAAEAAQHAARASNNTLLSSPRQQPVLILRPGSAPQKVAASTVGPSPVSSHKTAAGAADATTAVSPKTTKSPVLESQAQKGLAHATTYPSVSDPSAPSVQRSADDVVQMLQAMAAKQGSSSPVQQQLQHMAAAVAASSAQVSSPKMVGKELQAIKTAGGADADKPAPSEGAQPMVVD